MILNSTAMETTILSATAPDVIEKAAALLRAGQLVAFPTDTLYGVGAAVHDEDAVRRLYEVKERPLAKGIPILLAQAREVDLVAVKVPEAARSLMDRFWPGPLTVIVPRRTDLPSILAPGDTVAVRVPDHDLARLFIGACGGAIAATSANLSGQSPARTASEALAALGGRIAAVLDGGPVQVGHASTIIDCTVTPPVVVRRGPIPAEALREAAVNGS